MADSTKFNGMNYPVLQIYYDSFVSDKVPSVRYNLHGIFHDISIDLSPFIERVIELLQHQSEIFIGIHRDSNQLPDDSEFGPRLTE